MDGEIVLRRATPDDARALAALSIESSAYYARLAPELFAEAEGDGFAEWIAAEWDDGPATLALVAEVEGVIVGYVEAVIQEPEPWRRFFGARDFRERRLFVNAVLTTEAHRRRGVATLLVESAEAWGRERGATVALLDTWIDSPVSVPFWESAWDTTGARSSTKRRSSLPDPHPACRGRHCGSRASDRRR